MVSTLEVPFRNFVHQNIVLSSCVRWAGVSFYDDSKATNPDSTIVALEAFQEPVVVILGGRNKGMDFAALAEFIKRKSTVKWAVVMGEAKESIKESLLVMVSINISEADSLEEAVHLAYEIAAPGDVVLLSPACASLTCLRILKSVGDRFKEIVRNAMTRFLRALFGFALIIVVFMIGLLTWQPGSVAYKDVVFVRCSNWIFNVFNFRFGPDNLPMSFQCLKYNECPGRLQNTAFIQYDW